VTEGQLTIALDAGPDARPEECARLTQRLRTELLDLYVHAVEPAAGGRAPEGAKAGELLSVSELVVVLSLQRHLLRAVVDTVAAWLTRERARGAKLIIDGDTLELTGVSAKELRELVEPWLERHTPSG
jgi:hypothetical protein